MCKVQATVLHPHSQQITIVSQTSTTTVSVASCWQAAKCIISANPVDRGSRAIKDLWLRYLTEIDETTETVDNVLSDNPEINQALEIVERSAYTDADLYKYNDYLLEIMTHHNAMKNEREEGRAEGRAEGREQGRTEQLIESIKNLISAGFDFDKAVEVLKVPADQIPELRRLIVDRK